MKQSHKYLLLGTQWEPLLQNKTIYKTTGNDASGFI